MEINLKKFLTLAYNEGYFKTPLDVSFLQSNPKDYQIISYIKGMRNLKLPESEELRVVINEILEEDKILKDVEKEGFIISKKESQESIKLVDFINDLGVEKFSDQVGEYYLAPNGDGSRILNLKSEEFKHWLFGKLHEAGKKIPGKETLEAAKSIVCSQIFNENNKKYLSVRTACDRENNFWYDLGSQIININKDGYKLVENPPILFKRFKHQLNQVLPQSGGNVFDFLKFVNIKEESDEILLLVFIVSCFLSGFPHPVLVLFGQHGSSKSTLFKLIKDLVDPSSLKIMPPIKTGSEFIQLASHHWVCLMDNLSGLKHDLSDDICRACTGGGFSKRKLYSDDDDIIYDFQHIVGLNGINNVVINADLLDRSLLIELAKIPEDKRKTDSEIKLEFEKIKPSLLGSCLDIASQAIAIELNIKMDKLYRMADFTRWGFAIAEAMGVGGQRFLECYEKNRIRQNEEALESSPVAVMIMELLNRQGGLIDEEPNNLLQKLNILADELNGGYNRDDFWPKDSKWLTKRIHLVAPNLESKKIKVDFGRGDKRFIRIVDGNIKENDFFKA